MRIGQIDFLRGMAVLLVLFRHADFLPITMKVGWAGVDLFFVLSGFLVSGLLFEEYKKTKTVNPALFLTRRGFKIYPLFFALNIVVLGFTLFNGVHYTNGQVMAELFFFQNYQDGVNPITWSLAVEEHFYILLLLGVYLAVKTRRIEDRKGFHRLAMAIFAYCLLARTMNNFVYTEYNVFTHTFPTHLRIDSLLFGVVLAYNYHFNGAAFKQWLLKRQRMVLAVSLSCLATLGVFHVESFFMNSIGHTLMYLGFGGLLMLFVYSPSFTLQVKRITGERLFSAVSHVGLYSYSIYLFHMLVHTHLHKIVYKWLELDIHFRIYFVFYFAFSIITGVIIARMLEFPILRLREKMFPKYKPARQRTVPAPSGVQAA
jgi:peptidoglycan/LPS O-acetylase OafA/YrhL